MVAFGVPIVDVNRIDPKRFDRGQIAAAVDRFARALKSRDVFLGAPHGGEGVIEKIGIVVGGWGMWNIVGRLGRIAQAFDMRQIEVRHPFLRRHAAQEEAAFERLDRGTVFRSPRALAVRDRAEKTASGLSLRCPKSILHGSRSGVGEGSSGGRGPRRPEDGTRIPELDSLDRGCPASGPS